MQESQIVRGSILEKHSPRQDKLSSHKDTSEILEDNSGTSIPAVNDNTYEMIDDHVNGDEEGEPVYYSSKDSDTFGTSSSGEVDIASQGSFHSYQNIHHVEVQSPGEKDVKLKHNVQPSCQKGNDVYEVDLRQKDDMGYLLPKKEDGSVEKLHCPSSHTIHERSDAGRIEHSYLDFEGEDVDTKRFLPHTDASDIKKDLNKHSSRGSISSEVIMGPSYGKMTHVSPSSSPQSSSSSSDAVFPERIIHIHPHYDNDVPLMKSEDRGDVHVRLTQKRELSRSRSLPRTQKSESGGYNTQTPKETPV